MLVDLLHESIIRNAFIAGTIVAIVAAYVGYFVVLRSQSFAGEALTDIGFAGATGAAIFGVSSLVGMLLFALLSALGIGALGERMRGRDIEIGMFLSFALGIGVLFLSIYTATGSAHSSSGLNILFGSILSVTTTDIQLSLIFGIIIIIVTTFLFRPLLFASIDPEVAQTRGIPVRTLSIVFLLLLAATVTESVLVIGVLLVFALLIAPAATAALLTHRPRTTVLVSIMLSLLFTWGGLSLAFIGTFGEHLPVSFYISALASIAYFIAVIARRAHLLQPPRRTTAPVTTRVATMNRKA